MAGIGFELKKILREDSYLSLLKAYGYAGVLGSGPWLLSVLGVLIVSLFSQDTFNPKELNTTVFQISLTWMISASLVLSGLLQWIFTRYIADCLYQDHQKQVLPNLLAVLALMTVISCIFGILSLSLWVPWQTDLQAFLLLINFITLANVWILVIFVAGLRQYRRLLLSFLLAYSVFVGLSWLFKDQGYDIAYGKLWALWIGHSLLFITLFQAILREYPHVYQLQFDFLFSRRARYSLIWIGLFFNLGIWVDKWLFWSYPQTAVLIDGVWPASPVHDYTLFIAYLAMIPGMASFLLRIETDFVEQHQAYYQSLTRCSWVEIREKRRLMQQALRNALLEIFKVQGLTLLIVWVMADSWIQWLGLSGEHAYFLRINVCASSLLVLFIALLNVVFYFDDLKQALWMSLALFLLNISLTLLSFYWGPEFYGMGFALALFLVSAAALLSLFSKLPQLEYRSFMTGR